MSSETTLYLVDDDEGLRDALGKRLRLAGYHTRAFDSPSAFLASVPPDARGCAVFDLSMPGMSGLELLKCLQQRGSTLPVVFLSGCADLRSTVEAFRLGAVAWLDKPVSGARLLAAIEVGLARDAAAHAGSPPTGLASQVDCAAVGVRAGPRGTGP